MKVLEQITVNIYIYIYIYSQLIRRFSQIKINIENYEVTGVLITMQNTKIFESIILPCFSNSL